MPTPSDSFRPAASLRSRTPSRTRRYEPTLMYAMAEHLRRDGVDLHRVDGPWRPVRRLLRRPGRNAERAISIVTNGVVDIAVDTAEHAADLSGLLNAAGLDHLEPVPNLRPPAQDLHPAIES